MSRRSRMVSALLSVAVVAAVAGSGVASAAAPRPHAIKTHVRQAPGRMVQIQRGQLTGRSTWVGPKHAVMSLAATSTINVHFLGNGWTQAAKVTFQSAVDYWQSVLSSPVPIEVNARFSNLGGNTLGQAGPHNFSEDFTANVGETVLPSTWYPSALANKLHGADLTPPDLANGESGVDIDAEFDRQEPWQFGSDSVVAPSKISFRTVVMHELGHGLGFLGSMFIRNGKGIRGDVNGDPWVYDQFTTKGIGGTPMNAFANQSTALANALKSNDVWFDAPTLAAPVKLYAPSTFAGGSTFSHLDEKAFRRGGLNSLMTPIVDFGEGIATAGPVILRMMQAMGWNQPDPLNCKAPQDLDGDGFNDLIGISGSGVLTLGAGTGNGKVVRKNLSPGFGDFPFVALEDWNGDGCADLIGLGADKVFYMIPSTGSGLTEDSNAWLALADFSAFTVTGIAPVGDFDGDGNADLLVRTSTGDLWEIKGKGALPPDTFPRIAGAWGSYKAFLSPGDWDGDGNTDLMVVAKANNGTLKLFRGDGAGGFLGTKSLGTNWLFYNKLLGSRDLSGDGFPDLVGRDSLGQLRLERSTPTGGFQSPTTIAGKGWTTFKVID